MYLRNAAVWEYSPKRDDSPLIKKLISITDPLKQIDGTSHAAILKVSDWIQEDNMSIAKAYDYFRPMGVVMRWVKDVWSLCITLKYSFILWLNIKGKLFTKD